MPILMGIFCAVIGYLLGNIQTGILIGRIAGIDPRTGGSGNSGATNVLRVLGRKGAALTLLGDMLKGALASAAGLLLAGHDGGMIAALAVIIGHIWPVFFGFRGGKGAATAMGALAVLFPLYALIMVLVGVAVLLITKMVSAGSLVGAVTFAVLTVIDGVRSGSVWQCVFAVAVAVIVFYAHRANIRRILKGNENLISGSMFKKQ